MAIDTKEPFDLTEIQQQQIRNMLEDCGNILHMWVWCNHHIIIIEKDGEMEAYSIKASELNELEKLIVIKSNDGEEVLLMGKDDFVYTCSATDFNCIPDEEEFPF